MGKPAADRSCAHRCTRGRNLCALCLHYLNDPHQLQGAQLRGIETARLRDEHFRRLERSRPSAPAVIAWVNGILQSVPVGRSRW